MGMPYSWADRFYERETRGDIAEGLIGTPGPQYRSRGDTGGRIVETEAYIRRARLALATLPRGAPPGGSEGM